MSGWAVWVERSLGVVRRLGATRQTYLRRPHNRPSIICRLRKNYYCWRRSQSKGRRGGREVKEDENHCKEKITCHSAARTGRYCGLNAHLKGIGLLDTSLCECGHADRTPDRILQACPRYTELEKRRQTWPNREDLATKLWGTAEDLRRTASLQLKMKEFVH